MLRAGGIEDINYQENEGEPTPLHLTAALGHSDAFNLLLDHGANPHAPGGHFYGSVVHAACRGGNATIVRLLLSKGVCCNQRGGEYSLPLHAACFNGHRDIVDILLEHGVQITSENRTHGNVLVKAFENGHFAIAQRLIECGVDIKGAIDHCHILLLQASAQGNLDLVRLLLEKGVDPNRSPYLSFGNPLRSAISGRQQVYYLKYHDTGSEKCYDTKSKEWRTVSSRSPVLDDGHLAVVKLLINKGVHQNACDCIGGTPLHQRTNAYDRYQENSDGEAGRGILLKIMGLLLENGADVEATDWLSETPLIHAARLSQTPLVQCLLQHGANVNHQDSFGRTALWWAARYGHVDIVSYCLEKGADATIKDHNGKSPRDAVARRGYNKGVKNVVKVLDDHERQRVRH